MDPEPKTRHPMAAKSSAAATDTAARQPIRSLEGDVSGSDADPDAVLGKIRARLGEGRYLDAQGLAKEAADRFPGHGAIETMNRGLNGRIASTCPANGHSRREEFVWLENPPESVRGKLVALAGSEMVASADTMSELMAALKLRKLSKMPLVHRIEG